MNARAILGFFMLGSVACGASSPTVSQPSPLPQPTTPTVSSVSPSTATAGREDLAVTIRGFGFQSGVSFAVWSATGVETDLLTRYVSDSQLTAIIPAKLLKDAASAQVSVVNGDSMGWSDGFRRYPTSNAFSFAVVAAQPLLLSITSLSPATAIAGSGDVRITITGSDFQHPELGSFTSSFAVWSSNNTMLDTKYVSDTQVTAVIPANLLRDPASVQVSVVNGDSMGWSDGYHGYPTSNSLPFAVVGSR
jgi:IPT/TIG domain-containing protein